MKTTDTEIIEGLKGEYKNRIAQERLLYNTYKYFIDEGCRKYSLSREDSFSAYSDATLSTIHNIVTDHFDLRASIKTYLYQIFSNKCIDLLRKNSTNKQSVHQTMPIPDMLQQLPEAARNAVEKMIDANKYTLLKKHLAEMGEKCREILMLFEDGLTDREIAIELHYSNAAVAKTTRLRCLKSLRENMQDAMKSI